MPPRFQFLHMISHMCLLNWFASVPSMCLKWDFEWHTDCVVNTLSSVSILHCLMEGIFIFNKVVVIVQITQAFACGPTICLDSRSSGDVLLNDVLKCLFDSLFHRVKNHHVGSTLHKTRCPYVYSIHWIHHAYYKKLVCFNVNICCLIKWVQSTLSYWHTSMLQC